MRDLMNVLLMVSDDLRPEVGSLGGHAITPHLDKFMQSPGTVRFERSYVQMAICNPSRASFLTGRRPDSTRVWTLATQFREAVPGSAEWKTLPQTFAEAGYYTAGMGKIFHPAKYQDPKHANRSTDDTPFSWNQPYFHGRGVEERHYTDWKNMNASCALDAPDEKFSDGLTASHAVETLKAAAAQPKPWFVGVGFIRPHLPWVAQNKYFDMYGPAAGIALPSNNTPPLGYNDTGAMRWSWDPQSGPRHFQPLYNLTYPKVVLGEFGLIDDATSRELIRGYLAVTSQLDRNAGVVLDALESLHLAASTIVAFVGDHGYQLGDHGMVGKKTNFERSTRAPFVIRDPRLSPQPAASSMALVEFVDLMPTLTKLALGVTPELCPAEGGADVKFCVEGEPLDALMADPHGTSELREAAFSQYASCMHDDMVWHFQCTGGDGYRPHVMGYAIRTRRWRYVEWVGFDKNASAPIWREVYGTELYDHTESDSVANAAEAANLVAHPDKADVVAALSRQLRAGWRARKPLPPRRA